MKLLHSIKRNPRLDKYAPQPAAPQEETPNNATLYRQALADKDKRKLYYLASHLATLKLSNRIQFEWTMQEIEATFGKDIKMHNLRATITAEERKQKLAESQGKPSVADIAYQWASKRRTWTSTPLLPSKMLRYPSIQ
jgi:hypothetical protein